MKVLLTSALSLIVFVTLNSCKKANTASDNLSAYQKDSSAVNPMAHVMDSATSKPQDSIVVKDKTIHDKDQIIMTSMTEGSTEKAYLVFNDDQTKAEVFLPNEKIGTILDRKGTEGNYTWTDGKLELIPWKGYVLRTLKQGNNLFMGDVQP